MVVIVVVFVVVAEFVNCLSWVVIEEVFTIG